MANKYPPIQIVNGEDEPVGDASMQEVYEKGFIHRVVYVIVEDSNGKVLLQKRSSAVATYPNCWDISAAGHVDVGEDYEEAAKREMREELGLQGFALRLIDKYLGYMTYKGRKLKRFIRVYKTVVPANTVVTLQIEEVTATKWLTVEELKELIKEQPEQVAIGLADIFERYYK